MLDEVNSQLFALSEDAVSQIVDRFVSSLEQKFSEVPVSEKMKLACQGYTDFLARKVGHTTLENIGTVCERARDMVKDGLAVLTVAEKFAFACYYIELHERLDVDEVLPPDATLNELPTDDDLADVILEAWSNALYDRFTIEEKQKDAALDANFVGSKPETCPFCGGKVIPIVYGEPSEEIFEKADKGEVKLGGCILTGQDADWACAECGQEFYKR